MNGQTGRWTDGQILHVFYRTLSPSGPLPCFTIMQSRALGIADHILPVGVLLLLFYCYNRIRFAKKIL